jgi:hypothetical protein
MQVKPGKKDEALRAMMEDNREIQGFIAAYVYDTAGDELWGAAVFNDEGTYRANANDPEQDKWYRRLRECLVTDPEWHDGTVQAWPTSNG